MYKWYNISILVFARSWTLNIQQNTKALMSTRNAQLQNMSVINTLCAKFVSNNACLRFVDCLSWRCWLHSCHLLLKMRSATYSSQRFRSKPPSFHPGRPTCHGVATTKNLSYLYTQNISHRCDTVCRILIDAKHYARSTAWSFRYDAAADDNDNDNNNNNNNNNYNNNNNNKISYSRDPLQWI